MRVRWRVIAAGILLSDVQLPCSIEGLANLGLIEHHHVTNVGIGHLIFWPKDVDRDGVEGGIFDRTIKQLDLTLPVWRQGRHSDMTALNMRRVTERLPVPLVGTGARKSLTTPMTFSRFPTPRLRSSMSRTVMKPLGREVCRLLPWGAIVEHGFDYVVGRLSLV